MNLFEAFDALKKLDEETFNIDSEGVKKLSEFQNDDLDELSVYNIETDTDEEAEDFDYNGSVITECNVCHSKIFKNKDDIKLNEDHTACNEGEECPYCFSPDGYKIIGEVKEYEVKDDTNESVKDFTSDDEEEDFIDKEYHDASEEELIKMGVFDNLNDEPIEEEEVKEEETFNESFIHSKLNENSNQELYGLYEDYFGNAKHPVVFSGYRKWDDAFFSNEVLPNSVKRNRIYFITKQEAEDFIRMDEKAWKNFAGRWHIVKLTPHTEITLVKVKVDLGDDRNYDIFRKYQELLDNKEMSNEEFWEKEYHNYGYAYADKRYYNARTAEKTLEEEEELKEGCKGKEKEIKEDLGTDIDKYQKWVDYDMKKYGKISKKTEDEIKKAGLSITKDQYGEYEVIGKEPVKESLNEELKKVSVETEDTEINVEGTEDGEVNVNTRPIKKSEEDLVIEPVDEETKEEIERNSEEDEYEEEDEVDIDIDTFDEESFDELGESYLKESYNNVKGFGTKKVYTKGNKLFIEGIITFDTNNEKRTKFIFESYNIDKDNGKLYFIGGNKQINGNKKPCILEGKLRKGKLIVESLKNK